MTRATSTVVDVTLFLLFVGAAAGAVVNGATVESPDAGNAANEGAELLATSTAGVEYRLDPAGDPPRWTTNATASHRRTAHGTVAELLGDAAMSRVRIDGQRLSAAGRGFETGVANLTRKRLRGWHHRSSVRARWVPYEGAPVNATIRVGERPPPSKDVRAATLTVPSPTASVRTEVMRAADRDGYDGVARVVAGAVVDGLFPPVAARLALEGEYPSRRLVRTRYRRAEAVLGAAVSVRAGATERMNDELTAALTERFERDMRERFDSPAAAAGTVSTGEITITVRTWSP